MPGGLDLALGAHQPLRHRRLRRRGTRGRSRRVVRPPSVRSVSATCASMASAGWQQVKMSSSRSSGKVVSSIVVLHGLAAPRAGASSRPACGRGGCGRWRGCAPSSPATRPGWPGRRRAASARRRSRTPPARPPRRGRSRRGSRSAQRGRVPTASRKTCSRIATTPRSGGPRSRRPCGPPGSATASSIAASRSSASKMQVAAERLLGLDERAVGGQRLAVLHAHGRRRLGRLASCTPGVTPGVWLIAW